MRTVVVSDLHLGGRTGVDLARREELRAPLLDLLHAADRLVLLGDSLELRHGPLSEVLGRVGPTLRAFGEALGPAGEVVIVAGNHDHQLIAPWLEARRRTRPSEPLGLAETFDPSEHEPLATVARWLAPARVTAAYPGVWLADGVYAMHGHYLDCHIAIPTYERLAISLSERLVRRRGGVTSPRSSPNTAEDYEHAVGPIYAWNYARAQGAPVEANTGPGPSARAWMALGGDGRRTASSVALGAVFPVAVAGLNRLGFGPLSPDLSGAGLRRAGLTAIGEVIERLRIDADLVVFGHTHRAGPLPADDPAEWRSPSGTRVTNCGCWVYEPQFLSGTATTNPYWPGVAFELGGDAAEPRLVRVLADRSIAELSAGAQDAPQDPELAIPPRPTTRPRA